ncbi:MAG TPA: PDZ domain-containing protein [Pyrinomonadaceae bacterium]|nr:PDZ domain-containing protein [Pyrinomonadaceae bacterium]
MNPLLRKWCLCVTGFVVVLGGTIAAHAQPLKSITYRLSMTKPNSHLFEVAIEVELPDQLKDTPIQFQMAKWSPGRYAVFDFAKNVQEFHAAAGVCPTPGRCDQAMRPVTRVNDQTWSVAPLGSSALTIKYKVFANDLSGTFSQLDSRHGNYNGGTLFMYVVDHKPDPVKLFIHPPSGWKVVNGRTERPGQTEWQFPNWDVLIDTPTEIAPDWTQESFQVDGKKYHVVVHSFGAEGGKRNNLVRDIEKIVRAESAMWGPPEFDEYTFLIHFAADDRSGDGMEHLTSTQIIEPGALAEEGVYDGTLGTVAHEFFHVWNVKRLRPLELGPWDFTRPANTRGLWVAEGFTNYYGHLMMRRGGIWNDTRFVARQAETIDRIENAPGSRLMSAEESSLSAPFLDDAPHSQLTNLANTSISYYPKGELIGMVLDLLVRGRTKGKASLDDIMRAMYEEFYRKSSNNSYYLRGRGYTTEDVQRVASHVAGFDLSDFFHRYIRNTEMLPYDEALSYAGLKLVKTKKAQPYNAGLTLDSDEEAGVRISNVRNNSPAEDAGLDVGDEILDLAGRKVTRQTWFATLARYKPGDSVPITVKRDRKTITTKIIMGQPDRFEYKIEFKADATEDQKALRDAWLK